MIVRVRNLRVAVILIRDAVVVVVFILGVRLTVTIGVQLEVRIRLVGAAVWVGHRDRNVEFFDSVLVQLGLVREGNGDFTGVLVNLDFVAFRSLDVFRNRELRTLRSLSVLTVLVGEGRGRLGLLTRNNQLVLVSRLVNRVLVRNLRVVVLTIRDAVVVVVFILGVRLTVTIGVQLEVRIRLVGAAVWVGHRDRNVEFFDSVLVQLGLVREGNGDFTGVLVNLDFVAFRSLDVFRNRELRTLRSLSVLTVLVGEGRGRLGLLTRNNQLVLVSRLVNRVLVRNLRVAVLVVRDAVVIVILVLGVRLTVTIGVQLELRLSVVLAAVRVGHRHRNIKLFNGVLVQLRPIRERNGDLTGVLVNLDFITLRSREVFRNRELRTLRSLDVLTVLISERRSRLGLLTRNNQLVLILRLKAVRVLVGHEDGPRSDVVITRDNNNVVKVALVGICRNVKGAS